MFQFQFFKIPRTLSRDYCVKALHVLEKVVKKPQQGIVHLIVIDTVEMARMNEQFRGKSGPTDILTFSYLEWKQKANSKSTVILGQVYPLRSRDERDPGTLPTGRQVQENKLSRSETLKLSGIDSTSPPPLAGLAGTTGSVAGEIYLCLEKIKLYAKERWVTYREQLEYIVIHGLVHLMGYDHETEEEAEEMEKREKRMIVEVSAN